jgi:uncharacterized protein (TIGR00297 family)
VDLLYAALLAGGVAAVAHAEGALTRSGALAAAFVGMAVLEGAGWPGGAALATFFAGATLVSRLEPAGHAPRTAGQVLANGGPAALAALVARVPGWPDAALWMAASSLAAAAADTWATGVGATAPLPPRHILSGRPVEPGTSGGVTWRGTAAAFAGAALVGLAAGVPAHAPRLALAATAIGVVGMLFDSVLGATIQGRFHCAACGASIERRHHCGGPALPAGGLAWLSNSGVNLVAASASALLGWLACC